MQSSLTITGDATGTSSRPYPGIGATPFYSNLRFLYCSIQGKNCILVKSGIGKVNAARTTQVMLHNFDIAYVINLGAGGSINSLLNIGDVLIAKQVVQHDFDITAFGHSKGYITGVGDKIICDRDLVNELEQIIHLGNETFCVL